MSNKKRQNRKKRQKITTRSRETQLSAEVESNIRDLPEEFRDSARHAHKNNLTLRQVVSTPSTINEAERSVEAVIASENLATVWDGRTFDLIDEVLLMSGFEAPATVRLLDSHQRYTIKNIIGSVTDMRTAGSELLAKLVYAQDNESFAAWQKERDGHLRDNSIGYVVLASVMIEAGESAEVEGRTFTAESSRRLRISTKWRVFENSKVVIPADASAQSRSNDFFDSEGVIDMEWLKFLGKRGYTQETFDALDADIQAELRHKHDAMNTRSAPADVTPNNVISLDDVNRAAAAGAQNVLDAQAAEREEAERQQAVRDAHRVEMRSACTVSGQLDQDTLERAIRGEWPFSKAKQIAEDIANSRSANDSALSSAPNINVGATDGISGLESIVASLQARYAPATMTDADKAIAESVGFVRLHDVWDACIRMDGIAPKTNPSEVYRQGFSTTNLPSALGELMNKIAQKEHKTASPTSMIFTGDRSVTNFYTQNEVQVTDNGEFLEVDASGRLQDMTYSDRAEQWALKTFGRKTTISRQNFINDDLSFFMRNTKRFVRHAANLEDRLVYNGVIIANGTMSDGNALFSTAHKNLNTGAALNVTNLEKAMTAFRSQKDNDTLEGDFITILPKYLIVPAALEHTAKKLVQATTVVAGGNTSIGVEPNINVIPSAGLIVVSDPRLDVNSKTSWYLAADPDIEDTIVVGTLFGRRDPIIETMVAGGDVLGDTTRAYTDRAAKAVAWKGLQKNTA